MRIFILIVLLSLNGCAMNANTSLSGKDHQQITAIISKVAQQQMVDITDDVSPYLFVANFNQDTVSILSEPNLMPALDATTATHLVIAIAVAPGAEQLKLLTHGVKLSSQLQDFLQAQRFNVQRRFVANSQQTHIRIEPLEL